MIHLDSKSGEAKFEGTSAEFMSEIICGFTHVVSMLAKDTKKLGMPRDLPLASVCAMLDTMLGEDDTGIIAEAIERVAAMRAKKQLSNLIELISDAEDEDLLSDFTDEQKGIVEAIKTLGKEIENSDVKTASPSLAEEYIRNKIKKTGVNPVEKENWNGEENIQEERSDEDMGSAMSERVRRGMGREGRSRERVYRRG